MQKELGLRIIISSVVLSIVLLIFTFGYVLNIESSQTLGIVVVTVILTDSSRFFWSFFEERRDKSEERKKKIYPNMSFCF